MDEGVLFTGHAVGVVTSGVDAGQLNVEATIAQDAITLAALVAAP